mmetsp:Transcript_18158/g.30100  ORF Transcript_18158/g.30100 Transcript_18158/m.30100 type:complete len:872 (+) Transcript_18158:429-3044(+)|eukprot:CAMPEP_0119008450 /NCGR_PEP_ID=MMETSP1176-20130426/3691_1 /TAXON_ID=265551 /ORGANISM="Synedropsis recta cf, Strain CCMP1620" /LENGTH=871 /DNA_ID=CAMNT_0006960781 /DNA_START=397 /DNA_END=3012 /DNA_ORIENTATION=+
MTSTVEDAIDTNAGVVDPPKLDRRLSDIDQPLSYRLPPRLNSDAATPANGAAAAREEEEEEGDGAPTASVTRSSTTTPLQHNPSIDDESPAAESLRASAEVHVGTTAKLARKMHVEKIRKVLKKATQKGTGNRRGKPPRIPPNRGGTKQDEEGIWIVEEEDEEDSDSEDESCDVDNVPYARDLDDGAAKHTKPGEFAEDAEKHKFQKIPTEVLTATMETGRKLLAITDPHHIIQTQRWRRRGRKGGADKKRKSYVTGKVIDRQHELYTLSIAVMLGVRTSIGTTNTQMAAEQKRKWLTSDDFMATEKYKFKPSGTSNTPPHQLGHSFKFKDYSPIAFAYLRRLFGVNEFDFLLSVCGNANFIEFISNAKSGQFFFYSGDGKFMIKTMTNAESKFLRRILPHYFRHCSQNPNTMLTKFLGMYRVKLHHLRRNVKFIIMNSVYYTDKTLQTFYDLKGSVTGRDAKPGQDVKKDNDLRRSLPDGALVMNPMNRSRVRKQLVEDCQFMRRMKIMDYSLLIGIHHIPVKGRGPKVVDKSGGSSGFRFSDARKESSKFRELLRTSLRDTNAAGHASLPSNVVAPNGDDLLFAGASLPLNLREEEIGAASPRRRQLQSFLSDPTPGSINSDITRDGSKDGDKLFAQLSMHEFGLDEDDDNSFLEGSGNNPIRTPLSGVCGDLEVKKEQTIEQVYWPFHRLYDIHGYRRMIPGRCLLCSSQEACRCDKEAEGFRKIHGIEATPFVPPLSDRKDGGLVMDTTGYDLPIKFRSTTGGREHTCEGKIVFVGIIDILQQFNLRKRVEANYRRVRGSGWHDASCVRPEVYAERFIKFFDEYSQRLDADDINLEDGEEGVVFSKEAKKEVTKIETKEETKEEIQA